IVLQNQPGNHDFVEVYVNGVREYAGLWSALTGITINSGFGNDTIAIENTEEGVPVVVNPGFEADVVNVSPLNQNLDNIAGDLTINLGSGASLGRINIDDRSDGRSVSYSLGGTPTSSTLQRLGTALITYSGSSNDTVTLQGNTVGSVGSL